jgi:apolipoprotein N-acyltransferase
LIRFGPRAWAVAAPFLWTGLEYARSELYYLRFSWLNPGYAFTGSAGLHFVAGFGVYGVGFLLMAWAAYAGVFAQLSKNTRLYAGAALAVVSTLPMWLPGPVMPDVSPPDMSSESSDAPDIEPLNLTGVQLEGSSEGQIKSALDSALKKYPQTDLFVLSEYAFQGPVPPPITNWCKTHRKWLAAGGEDRIAGSRYYNSVFVVGPDGAVAFRQAKCVPVQFMKDGAPAREQRVWESPWGKLGFGICYDASYTQVTDQLIRLGAQVLIFPTMDSEDWGGPEHKLHGRIAPMRAAEYQVPVFRLCSSGISQYVGPEGRVIASAPFPGQGDMLRARIDLPLRGRIPPDRPLAQFAVVAAIILILFLIVDYVWRPRPPQ